IDTDRRRHAGLATTPSDDGPQLANTLCRQRADTRGLLEDRTLLVGAEAERERRLQYDTPDLPRREVAECGTEQVGIGESMIDVDARSHSAASSCGLARYSLNDGSVTSRARRCNPTASSMRRKLPDVRPERASASRSAS